LRQSRILIFCPEKPMHPVTIVFDLDGTLAETAPDIIAVLNVILADESLAPVPIDAARELVGAGARALIARGFERQGRPLPPDLLDRLFDKFLVIYADHVAVDSHLFPGVERALDVLATRGHRLAVCTNKPERHSRLLLDALGISNRFAAICGRDTFTMCKPDPRHFTLTVEMAGGDPVQAILIGDSKTDVDTARAAGARVIAVPFGYTMVPVSELAPDRIIDHFDDLPAAVAALLAAQA
jgi:phosphoglycolate phosphatase